MSDQDVISADVKVLQQSFKDLGDTVTAIEAVDLTGFSSAESTLVGKDKAIINTCIYNLDKDIDIISNPLWADLEDLEADAQSLVNDSTILAADITTYDTYITAASGSKKTNLTTAKDQVTAAANVLTVAGRVLQKDLAILQKILVEGDGSAGVGTAPVSGNCNVGPTIADELKGAVKVCAGCQVSVPMPCFLPTAVTVVNDSACETAVLYAWIFPLYPSNNTTEEPLKAVYIAPAGSRTFAPPGPVANEKDPYEPGHLVYPATFLIYNKGPGCIYVNYYVASPPALPHFSPPYQTS